MYLLYQYVMEQRKLKPYNFLNVITPAIDFHFYRNLTGLLILKVGWGDGSLGKHLLLVQRTAVCFPAATLASHNSLKRQLQGSRTP